MRSHSFLSLLGDCQTRNEATAEISSNVNSWSSGASYRTRSKEDESIPVHVHNKGCVAAEARYHRMCCYRYLHDGPMNTTEKQNRTIYDKAFETFCVDVVNKRLTLNK